MEVITKCEKVLRKKFLPYLKRKYPNLLFEIESCSVLNGIFVNFDFNASINYERDQLHPVYPGHMAEGKIRLTLDSREITKEIKRIKKEVSNAINSRLQDILELKRILTENKGLSSFIIFFFKEIDDKFDDFGLSIFRPDFTKMRNNLELFLKNIKAIYGRAILKKKIKGEEINFSKEYFYSLGYKIDDLLFPAFLKPEILLKCKDAEELKEEARKEINKRLDSLFSFYKLIIEE